MANEDKPILTAQKVQKKEHKIKDFFIRLRNSIRNKKNVTKNKVIKSFSFLKKDSIKQLIFHSVFYGLIINYSFWIIFKLPFYWYGFPAYGIVLYLIKSEILQIWRDLWFRTE